MEVREGVNQVALSPLTQHNAAASLLFLQVGFSADSESKPVARIRLWWCVSCADKTATAASSRPTTTAALLPLAAKKRALPPSFDLAFTSMGILAGRRR